MSKSYYRKDNSDDDRELLPAPAFAVEGEASGDGPPEDGMEYLRRVRGEAKKHPHVVVSTVVQQAKPASVSVAKSYLPTNMGFAPCKLEYLPSVHWERMVIADFSETREKLSRISDAPDLSSQISSAIKRPTPRITDAAAWRSFCLGREAASKKAKVDDEAEVDSDDQSDDREQVQEVEGREEVPVRSLPKEGSVKVMAEAAEPLLNVLFRLDTPKTNKLLEYQVRWLEENEDTQISNQQARWLYALMARLEKPLTPDVASDLRTMIRRLVALRSQLTEHPSSQVLACLNTLITIAAKYFGQASPDEVDAVIEA